jgi:hypothetical protein
MGFGAIGHTQNFLITSFWVATWVDSGEMKPLGFKDLPTIILAWNRVEGGEAKKKFQSS